MTDVACATMLRTYECKSSRRASAQSVRTDGLLAGAPAGTRAVPPGMSPYSRRKGGLREARPVNVAQGGLRVLTSGRGRRSAVLRRSPNSVRQPRTSDGYAAAWRSALITVRMASEALRRLG